MTDIFAAYFFADAFRGVVIVCGGITMGLSLSSAWIYAKWYREIRRSRLKYMAGVRLGIAAAAFMISLEVARRIGNQLTYRSAGAMILFALLIWSISGVLYDDEKHLH